MTIPAASCRAAVALALAGSLAACASGEQFADELGATDRSVAAVRQALDELDERMGGLERSLDRQRLVEQKLHRVKKRLRMLHRRLGRVRSGSASAGAQASEALGAVAEMARTLAVLENRLDYHLRRGHGGG